MAVTLESANLVRQKAYAALSGTNNPSSKHQMWWTLLREFFNQHVNTGNADLEFVPFGTADIIANTGYTPLAAAAAVYVVYIRNPGDGDGTDSYVSLHDATDNASATVVTLRIEDDDDEVMAVKPDGWAFATDVTISGATTAGGATESAAANAADGFLIVGAAK